MTSGAVTFDRFMHRFPPKLNFARRWVLALGAASLLAAVVFLGWLDSLAAAKLPDTVFWRARVVRLEPGKVEDYLTWAQAAFDVGRSDWAAEALTKAPKEAENRADWQNLMGGALMNLCRFGEAEEHFERAVELEPANPIYAVNLASLRLSSLESAI